MSEVRIGDSLVYVNPTGAMMPALVTNVWGPAAENPMLNVVVVSADEAETDSYGRQTKRHTSIGHVSKSTAHGNYWMFPGETPRPYVAGAAG